MSEGGLAGVSLRLCGGLRQVGGEAVAVRLPSPADDDLARGGGGAGGGQGGEVGGRRVVARGRGRVGTRLKQQEQGRQHESPLTGECGRERGWGQGGEIRPGWGVAGRFSTRRREGRKERRREGHWFPPLRRAGVSYVEVVPSDTPAEFRQLVERLVRASVLSP